MKKNVDINGLKNKWTKALIYDKKLNNFFVDSKEFRPENIGPGKFCAMIYKHYERYLLDKESNNIIVFGYGYNSPIFFDGITDALAYLRFLEIPRIMYLDRDIKEGKLNDAEYYLTHYDEKTKSKIEILLNKIDNAMVSPEITNSMLSSIRELYNDIFESTNPFSEIYIWGSIIDVLKSPYVDFEIDLEEEQDEDYKPITELKNLIDSNEFDETNPNHIELVKIYFGINPEG